MAVFAATIAAHDDGVRSVSNAAPGRIGKNSRRWDSRAAGSNNKCSANYQTLMVEETSDVKA
jgi:hypothetical protein